MFLETTPEGKIHRELAEYHFVDPAGLGKYALTVRCYNEYCLAKEYK